MVTGTFGLGNQFQHLSYDMSSHYLGHLQPYLYILVQLKPFSAW